MIEDIEAALKGFLKPELEEVINGIAEVREIFRIPKIGTVAGCYVTEGKLSIKDSVRVLRKEEKIYEGKDFSLKRFKDDVKEVNSGYECGVHIGKFEDFQVGDKIVFYNFKEIKK